MSGHCVMVMVMEIISDAWEQQLLLLIISRVFKEINSDNMGKRPLQRVSQTML